MSSTTALSVSARKHATVTIRLVIGLPPTDQKPFLDDIHGNEWSPEVRRPDDHLLPCRCHPAMTTRHARTQDNGVG